MSTQNSKPNQVLSLLWIVLSVNFIFCDVFTLMYGPELSQILAGRMGDMEITQTFLLIFAFFMEIPMIMILLSRILTQKVNRLFNLIAAPLLILIQAGSLFAGSNTMHYVFFSIVEIGLLVAIGIIALKWKIH